MDEHLSALEFRRRSRSSPPAERALAALVRGVDPAGARFRRLHAVGPYLLDLYCPEQRLAVEIGPPAAAAESRFHEEVRARYLAAAGIRVLVFSEAEILRDGTLVAREIADALARATSAAAVRARGPAARR